MAQIKGFNSSTEGFTWTLKHQNSARKGAAISVKLKAPALDSDDFDTVCRVDKNNHPTALDARELLSGKSPHWRLTTVIAHIGIKHDHKATLVYVSDNPEIIQTSADWQRRGHAIAKVALSSEIPLSIMFSLRRDNGSLHHYQIEHAFEPIPDAELRHETSAHVHRDPTREVFRLTESVGSDVNPKTRRIWEVRSDNHGQQVSDGRRYCQLTEF